MHHSIDEYIDILVDGNFIDDMFYLLQSLWFVNQQIHKWTPRNRFNSMILDKHMHRRCKNIHISISNINVSWLHFFFGSKVLSFARSKIYWMGFWVRWWLSWSTQLLELVIIISHLLFIRFFNKSKICVHLILFEIRVHSDFNILDEWYTRVSPFNCSATRAIYRTIWTDE